MSWPNGSAAAAAQRAAALTAVLRPGQPGEPVAINDVVRVLREHGEPEPIELTDADITQMRASAADLHTVFAAPSTAAAARQLNRLLRTWAGPPRLTAHENTAWHIHVDTSDTGPWAQWLTTSSAMALATLLTDRQAKPGGLCAAADCRRPFADLGRGAPRRYCSARCATRTRVAAHRRSRRPDLSQQPGSPT